MPPQQTNIIFGAFPKREVAPASGGTATKRPRVRSGEFACARSGTRAGVAQVSSERAGANRELTDIGSDAR